MLDKDGHTKRLLTTADVRPVMVTLTAAQVTFLTSVLETWVPSTPGNKTTKREEGICDAIITRLRNA